MAIKRETDVLVVGAGPVGLFAALSLVERGLDVEIIDKDWRGAAHSYALALHPESLRMLDEYGAAAGLLESGYRVERMRIYDGASEVGSIDFTALGGPFPFLLIAPQSALEQALEARLKQLGIHIRWNHQALGLEQDGAGVTAKVGRMEKYSTGYPIAHTEWMVAREYKTYARYVVGADGYHSFVRRQLDCSFEHVGDAEAFSVYEFPSSVDFGHEAGVVFHDDSTNVLWPLAPTQGRWSFLVDRQRPAPRTTDALRRLIRERAPWFDANVAEIDWYTTALFERRMCQPVGRDRVWMAGDAIHVTGPVGAQSMNVGLREAHDLAERFSSIHKGGTAADLLGEYARERRVEWSRMLDSKKITTADDAPQWARKLARRLLPCMPASGTALRRLLSQVGVSLS